jgi:mono/diheme cytochrome c family protein
MHRLMALAVCLSVLVGCGGSSQSDDTGKSSSTKPKTTSQGDSKKGIGPIKEIALGPIDDAVVAHGREIFDTKCSACHKFEERYVGPALAGVTKRREPEWIMNMILNPDEMIKNDEQAKALFTEYLTPMTFQNVSEEEAEAILTYFRSEDSGAGE